MIEIANSLAEKEFRALIEASKCAELRLECTVTKINEVETGVQATYKRKDGSTAELKGSYLVGADGKRGIFRKEYLEDKGIEQVTGLCGNLSLVPGEC